MKTMKVMRKLKGVLKLKVNHPKARVCPLALGKDQKE
jgi:hypothetical protein